MESPRNAANDLRTIIAIYDMLADGPGTQSVQITRHTDGQWEIEDLSDESTPMQYEVGMGRTLTAAFNDLITRG